MLYHLLPVVFWLLAISGSVLPLLLAAPDSPFSSLPYRHGKGLGYLFRHALVVTEEVIALPALLVIAIMARIQRHSSSVEQCMHMGVLLGIASYAMPTVVFLTLPVWAYLIYRNLFNLRSFIATILGYALIAIWAAVFIALGWIGNPWDHFFALENALGWIPLGAILLAWLASAIARQQLRIR